MPGLELYKKTFDEIAPTFGGPDWLRDLRRGGLETFKELGFPTMRNEDWRFTRVKPLQERDFRLVDSYKPNGVTVEWINEATFDDAGCHRIVIVDGHFAENLSHVCELPGGVRLCNLASALAETPEMLEPYLGKAVESSHNAFVALNTAFVNDGVFLFVPDNVRVEQPIHMSFVANDSNVVSHPRILVVAGKSAEVTIVESYIGNGGEHFRNVVSEFFCDQNANVNHCKLQRESLSTFHIAMQQANLSSNSVFSTENISIGGALVRNDVNSHLAGQGIDCRVDGLYLADERQHVDNHTFIRHAEPHSHSFELYKGILNGKARGVFNGRIFVDPDAQKTDAKQENHCILLSDDARINTNPQLEIFADDVKCTHGATIGQLDENSIFYMRSRGIDRVHAQHILIYAFAAEVIERIKVDGIRERLEVDLFWWLSKNFTL